jgi:tetratricopeptide (TPR) repeat protein
MESEGTMGVQWARRVAVLALSGLAAACAPPAPAKAPATPAHLIDEGRSEGLVLEDPIAIDDEMRAAVEKAVGSNLGTNEDRMRYLLRYLNDYGYVNFQYTDGLTLTARQAFHERRGDCMAYTNLFLALARHLGIPAYFVHVSQVRNYYERAGWFFVSSHVAVATGRGPSALVIDFSREISDWWLSLYESIDDGAALALYYNNVAVDRMTSGKTAEAEHLFRFFLDREPSVPELYNNLGVLLNRSKRHVEALSLLESGIQRFPTYEPFFTNALSAARGARRPEIVAELEAHTRSIEETDPYFLVAKGLSFYQEERYQLAARELERARSMKPDSPVILAWLTRAYLSAGRRQEGVAAFRQVRAMAPPGSLLQDLQKQFPELREVRAD